MTHHQALESSAAERYLLEEMSELERFRFEEHFFDCEECAETMRLGHRLRTDAKEIFAAAPSLPASAEVVPLREGRLAWRPSARVALPWAAAAVMAIGLMYQAGGPGIPSQDEEARAFAPVALRPASRGETPTVVLPAEGGSVALALDVNTGARDEEITYTLTGADGGAVATGRARVPAQGTPLLLLVPAERLEAGGPFVLTLVGSGGSAGPPAEYRFQTTR